jgi:hypothetical protein
LIFLSSVLASIFCLARTCVRLLGVELMGRASLPMPRSAHACIKIHVKQNIQTCGAYARCRPTPEVAVSVCNLLK